MKRKKIVKKILLFITKNGLAPFIIFAVLAFLCSLNFSVIPDGFSTTETNYIYSHDSLREILNQGVFFPVNFISWIAYKIFQSVEIFRIFGSLIMATTIMSMFYAIKKWHNLRIALLTTALFAVNSVILSFARSATDTVFMMLWFCFVAFVLWARYTRSTRLLPVFLSIGTVLALYIPGAVWFIAVLSFLYRKRLKEILSGIKQKYLFTGIFLAVVALGPLIYAISKDFATLRELLLIPASIDPSAFLTNILKLPSAFLYRMPDNPAFTVGRLPIMDVVTGAFAILGLYNYRSYLKWDRTGLLAVTCVVALLLSALSGNLLRVLVLSTPFVFMLIASGIAYLLEIWYDVFPRNPFARSFGTIILSVLVVLSGFYNLTRFYVVWPQTPETRATFNQKI